MLRVHLVFPPQFFPLHPYLSLATLRAYLAEHGIECRTVDLNNRFYRSILQPGVLAPKLEWLTHRHAELDARPHLSKEEASEHRFLSELRAMGKLVVDNLDDSLALLASRSRFYDPARFGRAYNVIHRALDVAFADRFPERLDIKSHASPYSPESSDDILRAIRERRNSPFAPVFDELVEQLESDSCEILGISCASIYTQLVPSMVLAATVRERLPSVRIVVGGTAVSELLDPLTSIEQLYQYVDAFVAYDGERALVELVRAVQAGRGPNEWQEIPNLIYIRDGEVTRNTPYQGVELGDLPLPNYDNVDFDDYFLPERIFSLELSRGCAWNKCSFCPRSGPFSLPSVGYRIRSPIQLADDMHRLTERHGARTFYLITEHAEARYLDRLADSILDRGLQAQWYTWARLQEELTPALCAKLARAGCVKLMFGFESAVPRVSDAMNKRIDVASAPAILRNCRQAGIAVHVWNMTGFPTETREEAERTYQTVADLLPDIDSSGFSYDFSTFRLLRGSQVYDRPEQYGLQLCPVRLGVDMPVRVRYEPTDGMVEADAEQLASSFFSKLAAARRFRFPEVQADHAVSFLYACRESRHPDSIPYQVEPTAPARDWLTRKLRRAKDVSLVSLRFPLDAPSSNERPLVAPAKKTSYLVRPRQLALSRVPELASSFLGFLDGQRTTAEALELLSESRGMSTDRLAELLRPYAHKLIEEGLLAQ